MELRTVLVEPKNEENIGAVARVLKNFGFYNYNLYMVKPPSIGSKARYVASHARDLLATARIVSTIEEAVKDASIVVGTTSKRGISKSKQLRMGTLTPSQLKEKIKRGNKEGILALLFGREDIGLLNEELKRCDMVVSIPTSPDYPVMNLSHAVAVVIYELRDTGKYTDTDTDTDTVSTSNALKLASFEDKERLFRHIQTFLDEIEYKEHKKERTMLMLRRLLGRAELTPREIQTLRGILRKAEWKILYSHTSNR
ncbi:RNA methyltransferase [Methanosarcinales archaeon]|nr:MAG: RNA methyltransferase [Methanosarcinales archaeon]